MIQGIIFNAIIASTFVFVMESKTQNMAWTEVLALARELWNNVLVHEPSGNHTIWVREAPDPVSGHYIGRRKSNGHNQ